MQLKDIKTYFPEDWELELHVTKNNKYCAIKINEDELLLNDKDFKDRILNPVMSTFKRTLNRI